MTASAPGPAPSDSLLRLEGVKKYFPILNDWKRRTGWLRALDDVTLSVHKGEILGIVGESGCGKSTLGKTVMGIHPPTAGKIVFEGNDITNLKPYAARGLRRHLQYTYQDPGASLDPRWKIGRALDVTIQAQILELMRDLSTRLGVALIIITHNLGVVARYADRVNVMYAGKIIEQGSARQIYHEPSHPYTLGLLHSVPRLDRPRKAKLDPIEGQPPDLTRLGAGCAFRPRCRFAVFLWDCADGWLGQSESR
jgi:oligopeptide/dipeptide ABC transporter ATP-binding protein